MIVTVESPWKWVTYSGREVPLPDGLEAQVASEPNPAPITEYDSRSGASVDYQRSRLPSRRVRLYGTMTFAGDEPDPSRKLQAGYEEAAQLAYDLTGESHLGTGKLYARAMTDRYLDVVWDVPPNITMAEDGGGVLWRIDTEGTCPSVFWQAATETRELCQINDGQEAGVLFKLQVGGQWRVEPVVTMTANGADVTDPEILHSDGRNLKFTGTLTAGQSLVVTPSAMTALRAGTAVLHLINRSYKDPQDRFWMAPRETLVTVKASGIATGGSLLVELVWRRKWL